MRVKLDEDLSPTLRKLLERYGHTALTVVGQGWGGLKDPELWPQVIAEKVFFITADKGFGDVRHYPPGSHEGILVLRPSRESRSQYSALLQMALMSHPLEEHVGWLIVVTPHRIRVRRPTQRSE